MTYFDAIVADEEKDVIFQPFAEEDGKSGGLIGACLQ